jgi:hypothetical protein
VNEYSSIYLWSDPGTMRGFLEGELFVGFDPFQWQLIDLTVWQNRPELRDASHRYALVHASVPGD